MPKSNAPKPDEIEIVHKDPSELMPAPYNPRDIGKEEMERLKNSIMRWGFVDPIIQNKKTGFVVGGNQRLEAAIALALQTVPVVEVDMEPDEEIALNIALNKISGDWNIPRLKDALLEIDTGKFDIELTGFPEAEIERLMSQFAIDDTPAAGTKAEVLQSDIIGCPNCGHEFSILEKASKKGKAKTTGKKKKPEAEA